MLIIWVNVDNLFQLNLWGFLLWLSINLNIWFRCLSLVVLGILVLLLLLSHGLLVLFFHINIFSFTIILFALLGLLLLLLLSLVRRLGLGLGLGCLKFLIVFSILTLLIRDLIWRYFAKSVSRWFCLLICLVILIFELRSPLVVIGDVNHNFSVVVLRMKETWNHLLFGVGYLFEGGLGVGLTIGELLGLNCCKFINGGGYHSLWGPYHCKLEVRG